MGGIYTSKSTTQKNIIGLTEGEMEQIYAGVTCGAARCRPSGDCTDQNVGFTPGKICFSCPSSKAQFNCDSINPLFPPCTGTSVDNWCAYMLKTICNENGICPITGELTEYPCWGNRCIF